MRFDVRVEGVEAVRAHIAGYGKQVTFATAKALTDVAGELKRALPAELERDLDRPTEFTKRGVFVKPARREDLRAVVGFMPIQSRYLVYQVEGGQRQPTKKALRLPSTIPLDAQGNIPPRTIQQLIAAARAGRFGKVVQRRLGVGGDRRKRGDPRESLFYSKPRGLPWPAGIYRRIPGRPGKLIPIIVFPQRAATYKPRFKFFELADRVVREQWPLKFRQALDYALATAR